MTQSSQCHDIIPYMYSSPQGTHAHAPRVHTHTQIHEL